LLRRRSSTLPLHPEWAAKVKKELKGKDPVETLTWKTAEVSELLPWAT
jgi:methylmalonyl-CoA mutase